MPVAFPKPKQVKRKVEAVRVYPDGREVCCKESVAGLMEYRRRKMVMLERQKGRCCLEGYAPMCPGILKPGDATFDHEYGRGAGKRDDRVELPDGTWINGACHAACNLYKGSRYIDYNRSFQQ